MTVNVQVALGETPLVAVQVTVVVPFANAVPDAGTQVTVGTGHPSAVGVVNVTTAVQRPGAVFVVMFAGQAPIVTALTTVALSGAIVTGLKLSPVTLAPDPVAGFVTLQTPAGTGLLMVTWNIRVTASPTGIVPRPWLMVSPLNGAKAAIGRPPVAKLSRFTLPPCDPGTRSELGLNTAGLSETGKALESVFGGS